MTRLHIAKSRHRIDLSGAQRRHCGCNHRGTRDDSDRGEERNRIRRPDACQERPQQHRAQCAADHRADQDAALSLSLVMLLVSIVVLVALRERWLGTGTT